MARRAHGQCTLCGKMKTVTVVPTGASEIAREDASMPDELPSSQTTATTLLSGQQGVWSWEGNIQSVLASWLKSQGFAIDRVANTASREQGKDIVAVAPKGTTLWVSVKGLPTGTKPYTQARHWFSSAVFDLVLYRDERSDVDLALAFPDGFPTYKALAARLNAFRRVMPFTIYWVSASGTVRADSGRG